MAIRNPLRRRVPVARPADDVAVAVFKELLETCRRSAEGDLEARAGAVPGAEDVPYALELRAVLNRLLDRTDAYVRESAASLQAASEGRFHRRFLSSGLAGVFRTGAETINRVSGVMEQTSLDLDAAARRRLELADRLEETVATVAEQVAAASTELSATASGLNQSAVHAGSEAEAAGALVRDMEAATSDIDSIVQVISKIAAQTQLLALNATIEAARAGEAGRGFAVVATEVKTLAVETAASTSRISEQVDSLQASARASTEAMGTVERTVQEMAPMVGAVSIAVDGGTVEAGSSQGLAEMAELLSAEVGSCVAELRAS
jgi:methyl-accepting chemotaxis protein